MAQSQEEVISSKANLLPTKDTLTALKADVTLESAILELCDNSLDAWKRTSGRNSPALIQIEVEEIGENIQLVLRDDTGGVPRDDAAMLFGLGRTAKDSAEGSIGTFGVGAKKSLVNLGLPFSLTSRAEDESIGWTYRIDEEWFEDEEDWTVPIYNEEDIEPGTTIIRIEDFNYDWDKETVSELRSRLGQAYNLFLSDDMQELRGTDYNLTITVDGVPVEPEGLPKWSYTKFDGLFPRRYENIGIHSDDLDEVVKLHITVGLLTKKDTKTAGTDIYCQERKIATSLRDEKGGYGSGKDGLGLFNPRHERLKVIIEIETSAEARYLPWDTQKSTIDKHNPIMRGSTDSRGVYNWLRRTVREYFDADADKVPRAFLEPYGEDHECAANLGEPLIHDFSGRSRVISDCRPDEELFEIEGLRSRIIAHTAFGVTTTEGIEKWQEDAYYSQLDTESDLPVEEMKGLNIELPDEVLIEPHVHRGNIEELARIHLENGVYHPDDLDAWQKPPYDDFFEEHAIDPVPSKTEIPDNIPATPSEIPRSAGRSTLAPNGGLEVYSAQKIDEEYDNAETTELFLVFGGESDSERGSRVLQTSRRKLCKQFDLDPDAGDDLVWEYIRNYLEDALLND